MACFVASTLFFVSTFTTLTAHSSSQRYISDELQVALRSGASTEYRIIAFLKSGENLRVQKSDESKEGWTKVKASDGKEGWVQDRYLTKTPSAKNQLAQAQKILANLTEKNSELKQSVKELTELNDQSSEEKRLLNEQLHNAQTEYQRLLTVSEKTLEIDSANQQLNQELAMIKVRLEELTIENGQLKESEYVDGITHGTIAVIAGCLLALVLPRLGGTRKRNNGWD